MNRNKRLASGAKNKPQGDYWVRVRKYGLRKEQTQPNHTKLVPLNKGLRMVANHRVNHATMSMEKVEPKYFAVPIGRV